MPTFQYKATTPQGQILQNQVSAASETEVASLLKTEGLSPLSIKKTKSRTSLFSSVKVSQVEKINFCRYLATIIKAGLPLMEAIELIADETKEPGMKQILNDLRYQVQSGKNLSSALAHYPDVFNDVFIAIIRAGEQSGTLEQSFSYLSEQLAADYEMNQKIKGILYYPAFIVATMLAVGSILLIFVLPRIADIFLRMNVKLPLPTQLLFQTSVFLSSRPWLFLLLSFIFLLLIIYFWKSRSARQALVRCLSLVPAVARFLQQIDLARFNRLLSTLLASGVPITESLKIASSSFTQPQYQNISLVFEKELNQGIALSKIFKKTSAHFPAMMIRLVAVGERTGKLEKLLKDLALFYEAETGNSLKNLISLLEPVLMLIIGLCVGGMVISIISPIYSILNSLNVP